MGLVARVQKLGQRVVPSKVVYLKNVVTVEELSDEAGYQDICADIRLEAEKFGAVLSIEVPRPRRDPNVEAPPANALTAGNDSRGSGGALALEDNKPADGVLATGKPPALQAPAPPDLSMAIVPAGTMAVAKAAPLVPMQDLNGR